MRRRRRHHGGPLLSTHELGRQLLYRGVPIGLAVGVLSGLFGIGGGALLIIGLLWLGFTQHEAHATSLSAMVVTAAAAAVPFVLAGEVLPAAALALTPAAVLGAYVGAGLMRRLSENRLRVAFALFLVLIAARMAVGVETAEATGDPQLSVPVLAGLLVLGLGTGVLSAIMGVGGGLILVPALVLLFGFSQHTAEGTSLLVVVPTALMGAFRHTRSGYTDWRAGMTLGVAGMLGGVGGALLALALEGLVLQRLFAVFLAVSALRLLRSSRPAARTRG